METCETLKRNVSVINAYAFILRYILQYKMQECEQLLSQTELWSKCSSMLLKELVKTAGN